MIDLISRAYFYILRAYLLTLIVCFLIFSFSNLMLKTFNKFWSQLPLDAITMIGLSAGEFTGLEKPFCGHMGEGIFLFSEF